MPNTANGNGHNISIHQLFNPDLSRPLIGRTETVPRFSLLKLHGTQARDGDCLHTSTSEVFHGLKRGVGTSKYHLGGASLLGAKGHATRRGSWPYY